MLQWLEMMKNSIGLISYISYSDTVKGRVDPFSRERDVLLDDLTTEDFQTLYTHEMNVQGVSANTVIHYHANICRALQYAVKIKLIVANLPDLVESPKKNNYVVSFYNAEELDNSSQ
ncbi:phage integrase SAM-like domain-containing protein [Paenibacillus polymyxa]|uniref:phage integrase SAM-like domain-containing protein n=1 Tax=Paenibacillus polymyxa TaxID=1406 RepID=UPI0004710287|nr:phage integrase SAM-like domain-containing protein [Paenibacillus polymyxa]